MDDKLNRLKISLEYCLKIKENQFVNLKNLLKSYSYTAVLERGFSLVTGEDGKIVTSADVADTLSVFKIAFKDGSVLASPVNKKEQVSEAPLKHVCSVEKATNRLKNNKKQNKDSVDLIKKQGDLFD